jgi:predicted AAA+ superfamily ATPase
MIIERKLYLDRLISKKDNGFIKIITGLRRCGKSYLLFNLYKDWLLSTGIKEDCIIELRLDEDTNIKYRNPIELGKYIREKVCDKQKHFYVFLDEIQKVAEIQNPYIADYGEKITFVDVLLGLRSESNIDLYVTGSNSKMLSSEVVTEFKDRGTEIKVNPLCFNEFYNAFPGDKSHAWREFVRYGGMPATLSMVSAEEKSIYLKNLFDKTYITDVVERHKINNDISYLEDILNVTASSIGSLTNATRLSNTFKSVNGLSIKSSTITTYINYFIDAFIMKKSERFDVKGKQYIGTQQKYYYSDIGLRNARLNFRQVEESHIMENIIYNELGVRNFNVDIGVVEYNHTDNTGKKLRSQLEIDFVANRNDNTYYIQSALTVADPDKQIQETRSLNRISDSFKKIVVVRDDIIPSYDDKGIYYIGIEEFLLHYIDTME